jgi:hypothetical protein
VVGQVFSIWFSSVKQLTPQFYQGELFLPTNRNRADFSAATAGRGMSGDLIAPII